jgi:hypothetical protein
MPVIKGSRERYAQQGQEAEIVDSGHPAGFSKMRCPDCKVGMMVERVAADGKKEFCCPRCHRVSRVKQI